jgi:DNA-3-methyladenine glycosylase I
MGTVPIKRRRCAWARNALAIAYHDREWGVPVRSDRKLFELLILEGAQAGLSWDTILRKRAAYRTAYLGFDPRKVARFDAKKKRDLMGDAGIVRNRAKIEASVNNAKCFLAVQKEFGSFARYAWGFVGGSPVVNRRRRIRNAPARTEVSDALSKDLKRRGFKFVGSTILYAFMQAVGMVNDHEARCFRWKEVSNK